MPVAQFDDAWSQRAEALCSALEEAFGYNLWHLVQCYGNAHPGAPSPACDRLNLVLGRAWLIAYLGLADENERIIPEYHRCFPEQAQLDIQHVLSAVERVQKR